MKRSHVVHFWNWIVFGALLLVLSDYLSYMISELRVLFFLASGLGIIIQIKAASQIHLSASMKILTGFWISFLASAFATCILWGYCLGASSYGICAPNQLRGFTFGNFTFPLVIIFGWYIAEIFKRPDYRKK
jgi:hypothetical protein